MPTKPAPSGPTLADAYAAFSARPLKRALRHGDVLHTDFGLLVVVPSTLGIPGFVGLRLELK